MGLSEDRGSATVVPASILPILLQNTSLVFAAYLAIGLEAASVPVYVHGRLGFSATLAGLTVSAQFVATLLNRPSAGRITDKFGAQATVVRGHLLILLSGLLLAMASWAPERHVDLAVLVLSRLLLGWGVSWVSTAGAVWGMERTGPANTAQVVAWNGVASYGSLALGAPLGLWISGCEGMPVVGVVIAAVAGAAVLYARRLPAVETPVGEPLHLLAVLRRVLPYGTTLALAAAGFGVFSSFVTLLFEARHWQHAALPLSLYGVVFVAVRLLLAKQVDRRGPLEVALVSLAIELGGLLLLAVAHSSGAAFVAAGLIGAGFSLVFPALCVEAIRSVEPRDKASAVSVYTGFIELSLAVAAPVAGAVIVRRGFESAFLMAFWLAAAALVGVCALRLPRWRQG